MALPDLITVQQYADATGTALGDLNPTQVQWAITAASQAVRDYTDRDFVLTTAAVQGVRTFLYVGGNELETDDCVSVSQVQIAPTTFDMGRILDPTEYFAVPNRNGTIDTINLFTLFGRGSYSPEMGFKQNLDTLPYIAYPVQLNVTAVWGWPEIPQNVLMATVWGAADFMSDPAPYNSESIAGYSHSYLAGRAATAGMVTHSLPDRAIALLEAYNRWPV